MRKKIVCFVTLMALLAALAPTALAFEAATGWGDGAIAAGSSLFLAIDKEGDLYALGRNKGMNYDFIDDLDPWLQEPELAREGVKYVSIGYSAVAVIDNDDTLWVAAEAPLINSLGRKAGSYRGGFVKMLEDVKAVSVGYMMVAALKNDGTLWMWGRNHGATRMLDFYAIGEDYDDDVERPVQVMEDVRAVSCQGGATAVIKEDGSLWMWGGLLDIINLRTFVRYDEPEKLLDDVKCVSLGNYMASAVTEDGALYAWGCDRVGIIDEDNHGQVYEEPERVERKGVAYAACGADLTATIDEDGTLRVWGAPITLLQLRGEEVDDDVVSVSCGSTALMYTKTDGSVWTWGSYFSGITEDGQQELTGVDDKGEKLRMSDPVLMLEEGYEPAEGFPWLAVALIAGGAILLAVIAAAVVVLSKKGKKRKMAPTAPAGRAAPVQPRTSGSFCPQCGARVQEGSQFCGSCGARLR